MPLSKFYSKDGFSAEQVLLQLKEKALTRTGSKGHWTHGRRNGNDLESGDLVLLFNKNRK